VDVTSTNILPCSFVGNVTWFRTNADGKLYQSGFTNSLTALGSTFSPAANTGLLDTPGLEAILDGGNLSGALTNTVTASANGDFTSTGGGIPALSLRLAPSTGVIRGSFSDPAAPIRGIIFQDQTNTAGFFLSGTNSGLFLLTPP
jgi:hypothetical protein